MQIGLYNSDKIVKRDGEARKVQARRCLDILQTVSSLIECMNYVKSLHESGMATTTTSDDIFGNDEVEIVQLTTSVKESLQFPEIEQIPDSSKNSEAEEVSF